MCSPFEGESVNMTKPVEQRFLSPIRIRFTNELEKMIKAKAVEKGLGVSEIVRQICEQHFENELSDTELLNHTLTQHNRKIGYLENKIELTAMIVMELARHQIRHFPEKAFISEDAVEKRFEEFIENCAASLKGSHKGLLESMVLDIYERSGGE